MYSDHLPADTIDIPHWQSFASNVMLTARTGGQCYQACTGLMTILHLLADERRDSLDLQQRDGLLSAALALGGMLEQQFERLHDNAQEQVQAMLKQMEHAAES